MQQTARLLKISKIFIHILTKRCNLWYNVCVIVFAVLKYLYGMEEMYYADRYHRTRYEKRIDGTVLYRLLRHSQ